MANKKTLYIVFTFGLLIYLTSDINLAKIEVLHFEKQKEEKIVKEQLEENGSAKPFSHNIPP